MLRHRTHSASMAAPDKLDAKVLESGGTVLDDYSAMLHQPGAKHGTTKFIKTMLVDAPDGRIRLYLLTGVVGQRSQLHTPQIFEQQVDAKQAFTKWGALSSRGCRARRASPIPRVAHLPAAPHTPSSLRLCALAVACRRYYKKKTGNTWASRMDVQERKEGTF